MKSQILFIIVLLSCVLGNAQTEEANYPTLFPVEVNGKHGFIDSQGKLRIEPQFDAAEPFNGDLALVSVDYRYGFINDRGEQIIPAEFFYAYPFHGGFARVSHGESLADSKFGIINQEGGWVIEPQYEAITNLQNNRAAFMIDNQWGIVNESGMVILPRKHEEIKAYSEEVAAYKNDGLWGFLDTNGEPFIQPTYQNVGDGFQNGICAVDIGNAWGFIDRTGKWIIAPEFTNPRENPPVFSEGLCAVRNEDDRWGFISKKGKWIVKPVYDWADPHSQGLAAVFEFEQWSWIDSKGDVQIALKPYVEVKPFSNGLARVSINFQWNNYINKEGKLIWPNENSIE